MSKSLESIRRTLRPTVGEVVQRRWPWPMWRMRGFAELPIGPEVIRFQGLMLLITRGCATWHGGGRRWERSAIAELPASCSAQAHAFFGYRLHFRAFSLLDRFFSRPFMAEVVLFQLVPPPRVELEEHQDH